VRHHLRRLEELISKDGGDCGEDTTAALCEEMLHNTDGLGVNDIGAKNGHPRAQSAGRAAWQDTNPGGVNSVKFQTTVEWLRKRRWRES
jgi:hypothetical protein